MCDHALRILYQRIGQKYYYSKKYMIQIVVYTHFEEKVCVIW